ncbi:hypothetical protein SNOG_09298 [Parastagonospora nodorum SN15]|uniref:Uncharacterized protein n=1 Tax=Phaeosphaeria nodorum (strain SN15 / ATCC MYA-4574 / FGSC 10173) TaxID=321614 RepID=Q0UG16_PHANO|nr:hypothetical protein SNOG_09298 [Parastagonospora nodorum SN15]EAT83490.1 hypothetical protein SNOG_09298 [Parastagonospora nodorum SN15]
MKGSITQGAESNQQLLRVGTVAAISGKRRAYYHRHVDFGAAEAESSFCNPEMLTGGW